MQFGFDFGGGFAGFGDPDPTPQKPVDNEKFYRILGIQKDANSATIRKAYHKLAMKLHPDKGGDPEKFKEISRAYEVLNDKDKRELYDQYGEEGLENGGPPTGPTDIFDLFMGGGRRGRPQKRRGEDVVFPLKVDLADLYTGCSKKLRLTRNVMCRKCDGKGGRGQMQCRDCRGAGERIIMRQIGPGMVQQMRSKCQSCRGSGITIPEKDKCKECRGVRTVKEQKQLEVFVEKGMSHSQRITFPGEADESPDSTPGDVIVVLQQKEHRLFKREGRNLFIRKTITLLEALTGFTFIIEHLDGRKLSVTPEPGHVIKPGDFKVIREEGMPIYKRPGLNKGDLYVEFDVEFPLTISPKSRKALKKYLPGPSTPEEKTTSGEGEVDQETVRLENVDIASEKLKFAQQKREAAEAMRGDDDDDEHEHEHVQNCRTQ